MTQKTDIWMPLYIGDYLADTARLTTEQHGAYLLLLMDYWRSGKLPNDDAVLAQICKLSPHAWSNARVMLEQFFSIENNYWVHKRVEEELEQSAQNKAKKHERALKGANARWNNASSNANAMLKQCPSPSPSPSPLPESTTTETTILGESKIPPCPHDEIIRLYHQILPELPRVISWTTTRQGYLKQRWRQLFAEFDCKTSEQGVEWFKTDFFPFVKQSKFLTGRVDSMNRKPFLADLEWMIKPTNFTKIIEGKYK